MVPFMSDTSLQKPTASERHHTTNDSMVPFMSDTSLQKPTASELQILQVLWERGPSTVREVHDALQEEKALGYPTVLKLMQIMTAKCLVRRTQEQRAHAY